MAQFGNEQAYKASGSEDDADYSIRGSNATLYDLSDSPDRPKLKTFLFTTITSTVGALSSASLILADMRWAIVGDFNLLDTLTQVSYGVGGAAGGVLGFVMAKSRCMGSGDGLDNYRLLLLLTVILGVDVFAMPHLIDLYKDTLGEKVFNYAVEKFPDYATEFTASMMQLVNAGSFFGANYALAGLSYPVNYLTPVPALARAGVNKVVQCFANLFKKCPCSTTDEKRPLMRNFDDDDDLGEYGTNPNT